MMTNFSMIHRVQYPQINLYRAYWVIYHCVMWYQITFQKLLEHIKIQAASQKPREIKAANHQAASIPPQPAHQTSKKVEPSIPIRNVFYSFRILDYNL